MRRRFAALGSANLLWAWVMIGTLVPVTADAAKSKKDAETAPPAASQKVFDESLFKTLSWRNIGPFRGGRAVAVAGVPQQPFTFYFGGTGGGLWKTTDAGTTWQNISDGFFKTGSVGAIAVAPSDPNVIWVGMGEGPVRGVMTTHGDGVYRSTDGGKTFQAVGLAETRHIPRIRVHPQDPDTAWVAVQGHLWGSHPERGVYKTTDGGKTWRQVLFVDADTGAADLDLDSSNPRFLYAAMWQHRRYPWKVESGGKGSGLYRSSDGGETWQKLEGGLPSPMGKSGISVSQSRPERVWALIESEKGGLYRSDDAGNSWRLVNPDQELRARSWYYMHLHADPTDADTVYVLNAPMMRSIDAGKTFSRVRATHGDNHDLWIHPKNSEIQINANDGGAAITLNGGRTWSSQNNQPTAQIYRVITDNQMPYRVYGGQQDNTSVAIASRSTGFAITERDWHPVGGCESAYVAMDPDQPRFVYAGCYQGLISVYDHETRREREIMAYPEPGLATEPAKNRYRFNWNAPIVASPQDPATIYHAGNKVLETRDQGRSWREISPDLTRDDKSKQGQGGGPFTNEGAGGEVYNTISTLVASKKEAGVLWSGSDDGKVFRREGDAWIDVTPTGLGEALINAIELSPHATQKAYLAVTRYKFDDLTPILLRTVDNGKTWTSLAGDLPKNLITRVVREDPTRPGLLYLGTESGFYVSWDDGVKWQQLQLNLPVVPITDLTVKGQDLVASTQGRAFWILDDLTPLRLASEKVQQADVELLPILDIWQIGGGPGAPGPWGTNPETGVVIRYWLKKENPAPESKAADQPDAGAGKKDAGADKKDAGADKKDAGEADKKDAETAATPDPLVLEIADSQGQLLRRVTSIASEGSPSSPFGNGDSPLTLDPGLNRWVWDTFAQSAISVPGVLVYPIGGGEGYPVGPGRYRATLRRGELASTREFEIFDHPKSVATAADRAEYQSFVGTLRTRFHEISDAVNRLADAKAQVDGVLSRLHDGVPGEKEIRKAGEAYQKALSELDGKLVQRQHKGFQDIINFPPRHSADWAFLFGSTLYEEQIVTAGMRQRFADLDQQWKTLELEITKALGPDLQSWEALLEQHALPSVILKKPTPLFPELPKKPDPEDDTP